jgi:hypothetical protein
LKAVLREFGVGRKWLMARINDKRIRSARSIGGTYILEHSDIEKLCPANVGLYHRAKKRGKK